MNQGAVIRNRLTPLSPTSEDFIVCPCKPNVVLTPLHRTKLLWIPRAHPEKCDCDKEPSVVKSALLITAEAAAATTTTTT